MEDKKTVMVFGEEPVVKLRTSLPDKKKAPEGKDRPRELVANLPPPATALCPTSRPTTAEAD